MELIVELVRELADDLAAGRRSARADALREELRGLDAALEPLHPGTADPALARYYLARVPAGQERVAVARLSEREGVVAAYAKPVGEPP